MEIKSKTNLIFKIAEAAFLLVSIVFAICSYYLKSYVFYSTGMISLSKAKNTFGFIEAISCVDDTRYQNIANKLIEEYGDDQRFTVASLKGNTSFVESRYNGASTISIIYYSNINDKTLDIIKEITIETQKAIYDTYSVSLTYSTADILYKRVMSDPFEWIAFSSLIVVVGIVTADLIVHRTKKAEK